MAKKTTSSGSPAHPNADAKATPEGAGGTESGEASLAGGTPDMVDCQAVSKVIAERVLVLAPHQDDELLGCGGLLHQLVESGASVEVLFLSDGGGGVEASEPESNLALSELRRKEAEAVAEFGGWTLRHLALPDGELMSHEKQLVAGIKDLLLEFSPDLLLVPSPFEVTTDHTAAFAALFEVLTELRPGAKLFDICAGCRVLGYSVNHVGYANLLVDVGEDMPWLEQAMAFYKSQLALHNYTAAGIGVRRFRTHALGPSIQAAEGYIALRLEDFTTHSLESLVKKLGPGPRIAVHGEVEVSLVVRTFNRPELLREALLSVAANMRLPREVVVVNDGGRDPKEAGVLKGLPFAIERVNLDRNGGRAAAANVGLRAASAHHVGFLDDDDLLFPEHFQVMSAAVSAAGVQVAYSDAAVATYELAAPKGGDGSSDGGWQCVQRGLPYSRDFDRLRLLVDNYIPFHTLLMERSLALEHPFDEELSSFEDWDFLIRLSGGLQFHHVRRTTCEYRHFVGSGHHALGVVEDASLPFLEAKSKVMVKHQDQLPVSSLARAVTELRHETVQRELEVADLRVRWESDRLARAAATERSEGLESRLQIEQDRYHREHGEVESLRREDHRLREKIHGEGHTIVALRSQLEELDGQNGRLGKQLETLDLDLGRTYAEIERLMGLIEAMEGTRAWQFHEFLQRRKG